MYKTKEVTYMKIIQTPGKTYWPKVPHLSFYLKYLSQGFTSFSYNIKGLKLIYLKRENFIIRYKHSRQCFFLKINFNFRSVLTLSKSLNFYNHQWNIFQKWNNKSRLWGSSEKMNAHNLAHYQEHNKNTIKINCYHFS